MFVQVMDEINTADSLARKTSFRELIERLHQLRRQRNNLLHSAYIELKSGGEVQDIVRVNPKILQMDDEVVFDAEMLTLDGTKAIMEEAAQIALALNIHYTQLIYWSELLPHQQ